MAKKKFSKDELREEIVRCGRDPIYFIRKYARIKHPVRGVIPFNLWDFQERLLKDYLEHRFNVILKARQLGATETVSAFCAWLLMFHRDKNILCVATKAETAKNIIRRVKTVIQYLPKWLCITRMVTDNVMSMEFDNGSVIKAIASSKDAGRSEAVSLLVVDEAAFIENLDTIWTGLLPVVTAGGRVIMISTPNGVGNVFHETFTEAKRGGNKFNAIELQWWMHPEHISDLKDDPDRPGKKTSTWFREETRNMSVRQRAQEHELDFLSSGDTFTPTSGIEYVRSTCVVPSERRNWDTGLWVWNRPMSKSRRYHLSADTARGDGRDNSAFHIFDTDDMVQCAEYCGKLPVDDFAKLMCDTAWEYNRAVLVVENNSLGLATLEAVRRWRNPDTNAEGYPSVYATKRGESDKGEVIDAGMDVPDGLILGLTTSAKTRPVILAKFEEYIRTHNVVFRSSRLASELETFIWHDGKPEAMAGHTDDLIMGAAFGIWIRDIYLAPNLNSAELHKQLILCTTVQRKANTEIPGASKNPHFVPRLSMGAFSRTTDTYRMRVGNVVLDMRQMLERKGG